VDDPAADEPPVALSRWLERRFGGPVQLAEPPSAVGDGFDSATWVVRYSGATLPEPWRAPLVLRIKASADRAAEAEREAAIQAWVADRGYPAPRVLAVLAPGEVVDLPAQVMERAPGSMLLDHVRSRPWQAPGLLRRLADLQADLHDLPVDGFPAGEDLLDRRLRLTRAVADQLDDGRVRAGLDRVEALTDQLRSGPLSVCHGDFHPLNVMATPHQATVIDWTDAGLGDRHGDVARTLLLFELAAIAAESPVERRALRLVGPRLAWAHRRRYLRRLPLDGRRLELWTPVHLLHGWAQMSALRAGLLGASADPDDRVERVPPELVDEVRRRFDTAVAAVT
jgi:aminoglycoside phosphotransferase (APT) family kinase protein